MNLILKTDSYKASHWKMLPPEATKTYCYFEARKGGELSRIKYFGLTSALKHHLSTPITLADVAYAKKIIDAHMGPGIFNEEGWLTIVNEFGGKLPIIVWTVPEGKIYEAGTPLLAVENTDPRFAWLPSYLESVFEHIWYSSTVATISYKVRQIIKNALEISGTPDLLDFKLHDFGVRGASSFDSAAIGGAAHLTNFKGTDNLPALELAQKYYGVEMAGFSIPAAEHSCIIPWRDESEFIKNLLEKFPSGMLACPLDTYDLSNAILNICGKENKNQILAREGVFIGRPDSGHILEIVPLALQNTRTAFDGYVNEKGFFVLSDKVRIIQGDGCTPETIEQVVDWMIENKWSIDNIAFGMGGGLLQKVDRDMGRFAHKASSSIIMGVQVDYCKTPKTDLTKSSKSGRFDLPIVAYENGNILYNPTWDEMYG